jgi:hypothetical protein
MLPLFDHPGFVHQENPVFLTQGFDYPRLMSLQHPLTRPGTLPYEVLQTAHIHSKPQSDPLGHFARQIAQQTFQIHPAMSGLIITLESWLKVLIVPLQFVNHLVNIFLCQIPFRRRANFVYNFCGHGNSFLLSLGRVLEKVTMSFSVRFFSTMKRDFAL